MIVGYLVATGFVVVVALGAFVTAWHHGAPHPITDLRRRQLDTEWARHGVHDPRPRGAPDTPPSGPAT